MDYIEVVIIDPKRIQILRAMTDLIIPGSVLEKAQLSPEACLLEIAFCLYDKKVLSLESAIELSRLPACDFKKELDKREVVVDYEDDNYWQDAHCF